MLNWYRATPIVVPKPDAPVPKTPLLDIDPINFTISMPHLVLWGMEDTALLPVSRQGLDGFAKDLSVVEIEDAGHWVNHTHSELIGAQIANFIRQKAQ